MFFTVSAAVIVGIFAYLHILPGVFKNILWGVIPHAMIQTFFLGKYLNKYQKPGRIDRLIVLALVYLMWFALVPLLNLL